MSPIEPPASAPAPSPLPSRALWLVSLSGLVPFLTCLGIVYQRGEYAEAAKVVFLMYTALTLSFLGGARWGAELARAPHAPNLLRLVAAAMPSVVGLLAMVPQVDLLAGYGMVVVSSVLQLAWDVSASRAGLLPSWNGRLRTVMTALGLLCTAAMGPALLGG
ncbi:DUF3429 domain-containing protein [Gemmatimonas sp.]|uniref:DUF3429 domain-containing protein n=1 Tax=Gemmatimonas sp. TaxID=1962908 RepID=UPI0031BFB6CF|nr:DUF3429 domain-containing protein [Gemmatimonas sp.]